MNAGTLLDLNDTDQRVGGITGSGNVHIGSATLTLGGSSGIFGTISGTGDVNILGSCFFRQAQLYTGSTTVSGFFDLADDYITSTSEMILNGGFLTISSTTTVTINNLSGTSSAGVFLEKATSCMRLTSTSTTTYNGTINSSLGVLPPDIDGGIIKEGTGSITLTNNGSIYTGGTQFNGGTLAITATDNGTSSGPLGNPTSGTLSFNTGTLQIGANFTTSKAVVLAGPGTIQVDPSFTSTFNSGFTGPGSFTKSGGGTLILSSLNLYTGNTFITGGTLRTNFNQAFLFSPSFTISSGAIFDLNGTTQQISNLFGAGIVALGSGTCTLLNSTDNTFSGAVTGTGEFIKDGSGSFNTSGAFNLTGNSSRLALQGGEWTVNGSATAHLVTVLGGTLKGTGTITSTLPLQIDTGGVLSPGNSPGSLSVVGDVIFSSHSFLNIEVNPTTASQLFATGTVDVTDATLLIDADIGMYTAGTTYDIDSASSVLTPFQGVQISSPFSTQRFLVSYFPDLIQIAVR